MRRGAKLPRDADGILTNLGIYIALLNIAENPESSASVRKDAFTLLRRVRNLGEQRLIW